MELVLATRNAHKAQEFAVLLAPHTVVALPDHVVLCTHADNTPSRPVPVATGAAADEARAKNRRITIEDLVVAPHVEEK